MFFPKDDIAFEIACEKSDGTNLHSCTTDMYSFKGYVARWLTQASQLAPFIADKVLPVLRKSAEAAVKQCTGGESGRDCGFSWQSGVYDGKTGAGQQMNVLGAVSALLVGNVGGPVTADSGGTSKGDPNAGQGSIFNREWKPITTADKAGAGILTAMLLGAATGTFGWMSWERR